MQVMIDSCGFVSVQRYQQNPETMVRRNRIGITRLRRVNPDRGISARVLTAHMHCGVG